MAADTKGHYGRKGTITIHAKAGTTKEYVDGSLGHGKKLTALKKGKKNKPTHYKVAIVASSASGISATSTLSFTVKHKTAKRKK